MPLFRNQDRNVLFVHVPKTGGSSVERLFRTSGYQILYRDQQVGKASTNWLRRCSPQHMHASMLEQLFDLSRFDLIFMVVREPLARFRSEYSMRNGSDLKVDAESVDSWSNSALAGYAENNFVYDNHLRPQTEFYLPGCIVYRLEDGIETMVEDLNSRFDLGLAGTLPRMKDRKAASGVASDAVELSPGLESRLRYLYSADYAQFGY